MGMVRITADLGANPTQLTPLRFLVDTGSMYSFVTPELAEQLGVRFTGETTVITGNSTHVTVPLAFAYMRVLDRENTIILGALDVPEPVLGALTLQILGLKVDPVNEILEHSRPYNDIPILTAAQPS